LLKGNNVKQSKLCFRLRAHLKTRTAKGLRPLVQSLAAVGLILGILGCSPPPKVPEICVIKAGTVCVSKTEFGEELDLKLTAYPYDLKDRPMAYNQMVLDLVAVISDETVLLAGAAENGVKTTAKIVDQAEAEFKKDYPEDSFEQMLLENAIPYRVWKRRLKKDLTIQRFLKDRLVNNQEISPGDMIAFYDAYRKQVGTGNTADIDEGRLVEMLRLEKSQAAYDNWIASLKTAYPVSIDKAVLAEFLVNQSLTKKNTPNQD